MRKVPPVCIKGATVKDVAPGEYGYIDPKDIWIDGERQAYLDPDATIHRRDDALKFSRYTLYYQIYVDGAMTFQQRDAVPSTFIPVEIALHLDAGGARWVETETQIESTPGTPH